MSYTIPSDTHAVGDAGHTVIHNNIADMLTLNTQYNVKNTAYAGGAAGNGTTDDTAAIQAAVTACINGGGGIVVLPPGTYKTTSTITGAVTTGFNNSSAFGTPVYIVGAGCWATIINYYGTGDCLRIYGTEYPYGGGITGLTIDGTNASAGAKGLHMGDIFQYKVDIAVQNFTGTGSIGAWFDNNYFWTEQLHGQIFTQNCTTHVKFDNSANTSGSATGSFFRAALNIFLNDTGGQNGVVFANKATIADGNVGIYGNSSTTVAANSAAVLTFGNNSEILNSALNIGVETDSAHANAAQTINFGTAASGAGIVQCTGSIDFIANGTFVASNFNIGTTGAFQFYGPVYGDTTLDTQFPVSSPSFTSGTALQLSTLQDCMLYIAVQTSAALAVALGPTSTPASTICPSKSYALSLLSIRVPIGWYVKITGTIADLTITQVGC